MTAMSTLALLVLHANTGLSLYNHSLTGNNCDDRLCRLNIKQQEHILSTVQLLVT